jgi:tRNA pseudouridine38-40 synthase
VSDTRFFESSSSSIPSPDTERNLLLTVAFDGTDYCGWQVQPGLPTVQGCLQKAIAEMEKRPVTLRGASRTDSGVHACGHTSNFRSRSSIPLIGYLKGLNAVLPASISILRVSQVPADFDARRSHSCKHYRYAIHNTLLRNPLIDRYTWYLRRPLNEKAMQQAAAYLHGEHDFDAFRAADCSQPHARRTITEITVRRRKHLVTIDVRGPAFLKNMVRIITGTLVWVGWGKIDHTDLVRILEGGQRSRAGITAPPCGLCLQSVTYAGLQAETLPSVGQDEPLLDAPTFWNAQP